MKKTITLLIAAIFFLTVSSYAQINKGSILIGGTLSAYSENAKNPDTSFYKQNNFQISPSVGFAVDVNTVLGFSLLYGTAINKGLASFKTKNNSYGAGIFLRKYKLLAKNFYLFGEGNLSFQYESYNYATYYAYQYEYDSKAYGMYINFSPGVAYSLTSKLQLEAGLQNLLSIGYTTRKENSKNSNYSDFKENNFNINSSFDPVAFNNISLGLRFLINK